MSPYWGRREFSQTVGRQLSRTAVCCMLGGSHVPRPVFTKPRLSSKNFLRKNTFSGPQKFGRAPARYRAPGREPPGGPQPSGRTKNARGPAGASHVGEPLATRPGCTSSPPSPLGARKEMWGAERSAGSPPGAWTHVRPHLAAVLLLLLQQLGNRGHGDAGLERGLPGCARKEEAGPSLRGRLEGRTRPRLR